MISRRELLKGMVLTAAGLLVPEQVVKVFYSIPKVVSLYNNLTWNGIPITFDPNCPPSNLYFFTERTDFVGKIGRLTSRSISDS